jgi:hypothetical protein
MQDQLITIVNSYAAARASGDTVLQQFAAQQLGAFLEAVEIVPKGDANPTPTPEENPANG